MGNYKIMIHHSELKFAEFVKILKIIITLLFKSLEDFMDLKLLFTNVVFNQADNQNGNNWINKINFT